MLSKEVLKRRGWKDKLYSKLIENSILHVLEKYVGSGLVIDVGGNTGYQTYFHSQYNNVVTYEPVPELFDVLKENLKNLDNVTFINKAVGAACGTVKLYVDVNRLSMTSQAPLVENEEIEVPIVSLDSEDHEDVCFIKVDVEGFELEVLKGAVNTIEKYKPTCMVEIYEPWCEKLDTSIEEHFKFFVDRDYIPFYFNCETESLVKCESAQDGVDAVRNLHHLHDADFLFIHKDKL
jgi:FkbM family methyltransferase